MNEQMNSLGLKLDKLANEVANLKGWIKGLTYTVPAIGALIIFIYLHDINRIDDAMKSLEHPVMAFNKNTILYGSK